MSSSSSPMGVVAAAGPVVTSAGPPGPAALSSLPHPPVPPVPLALPRLSKAQKKEMNRMKEIAIPRPPPDFRHIPAERAVRYIFDENASATGKWRMENIWVKIER